jgi:hypothetical protein
MDDTSNVVPFAKRRKALNARGALVYLAKVAEGHPDGIVEADSITHLGRLLGWTQPRTSKAVKAWKAAGQITVDHAANGKLVIRIMPIRAGMERDGMPSQGTAMPKTRHAARRRADHAVERAAGHAVGHAATHAEPAHANHAKSENTYDKSTGKPLTVDPAGGQEMPRNESASGMPSGMTPGMSAGMPGGMPQSMPSGMPQPMPSGRDNDRANHVAEHAERFGWRRGGRGGGGYDSTADSLPMSGLDVLIVIAALSLAGVAAWMSVHGMIVLFPGDPMIALWLGASLEGAKILTAGWLGHRWAEIGWGHRIPLILFVAGVASINAVAVYSHLVNAHLSEKGAMQAGLETSDAQAGARIEVAQGRLADIDRRLAQIDGAVEAASRRGAARTSVALIQQQKNQRTALAEERQQVARSLADLKADRAAGAARGRAAETEAAPIMYVAELLGIQRGGEEIIRWLIALIVATTDPFALALAAAIASRRRRTA